MIAKLVYIVGVVLAVLGCIDIWKSKKLELLPKIIFMILLVATSWIGLLVYYFIIRDRI